MKAEEFFQQVSVFLAERARVQPEQISPDTDFIANGWVDSVLLIDLFFFVEDLVGCRVSTEGLTPDSFSTARKIFERFVVTARGEAAP
jgi:acyl carrier protein